MKLRLRTWSAFATLLFAAVGCSNGNGVFGLDLPDGNIVVTDALTGAVLNTSASNPLLVPDLRFSIGIAEGRFNGPYTVTFVHQQNLPTASNNNLPYFFSYNVPCFVPHQTDTTSHINTVTFQGDNANGQASSFADNPNLTPAELASKGNPCHSGELEIASIGDGKGHTVLFYYEEE